MATKRHEKARGKRGDTTTLARLCAFSCLFVALPSYASSNDAAFVAALRERGLQRLAEGWCRRELAKSRGDDRRSAQLVGFLSQLEVDRALAAAPADRDAHWRAAARTIDEFLASRPENPTWVLLRLQQALATRARGEAEQLESAARGDADATQAARSLRLAARQLDDVAEEVEAQRNQRAARRDDRQSFSERELASLANQVAVQQATTLRAVAECHPAGSPDRDDALLQAVQLARRLSAQSLPADLLWRARLTLLESERLLGNSTAALTALEEWNETGPPPPRGLAAPLFAERWRLLRNRNPNLAERWFQAGSPALRTSPEMQLARLAAAVEALDESTTESSRNEQTAAIQQTVANLRSTHGGWWGLRAEAVAGAALQAPAEGSSTEALVASAEYLYRGGRFDEAVDAYDKAAATAYRRGARGRSFELALAAAAIRQLRKEWSDAATRFHRAALANATHPEAPTAHRTAAVCASQALRAPAGGSEEAWQAYFELLEEHLASWPASPTASELRWWLIEPLMARGEVERTIGPLSQVTPNDPRYAEAVRLLGEAWLRLMKRRAAKARAARVRESLGQATTQLQSVVTGPENRWPAVWTAAQREGAVGAARVRLDFDPSEAGAEYAEQVLRAAIEGAPAATDEWLARATPLLAAALIRQTRITGAAELLGQRPPRTKSDALPVLAALGDLQATDHPQRKAAGELTLTVLTALGDARNQNWRLPYRAAALAAVGRGDDALAAARELATAQPDNAAAQRQFAQLLSQQTDAASQREALALWQTIEKRTGRATEEWFRARLARIELLGSLGQDDQAAKLLEITRVLHPDLGGLQAEFESAASQQPTANGQ